MGIEKATHGPVPPRLVQPGGVIHTRIPYSQEIPEIEDENTRYLITGMMQLAKQLGSIARMAEDRSRPVDEYISTSFASSVSSLEVLPQFEIPELITSIIVEGPVGAYTLQLGDRSWTPTMPAAGVQVFSPISMMLSRNDRRILSSAVPGDWSLELMGWADDRY